jgi:limonene-1,2-epoxide hydrolase
MAGQAEKVVSDFCGAWSKLNVDEIMRFFTDDAVYHNIPMPVAKGKDIIRKTIEGLLKGTVSIKFDILHTTSAGNIVMNERVDSFEAGGKHVSLPVAGVFEITDAGKIKAWRDYFDLETYMKQIR